MIDLNATQAAIRAGYSKKTAGVIGYENLTKPQIRAFIDKKLEENSLSKQETVKLISDIARGNLGEYFVTKKIQQSTLVEKHLKTVIAETKLQIEFEEEYAGLVNYTEDELKAHQAHVKSLKRDVIRMELELKKNPKAFRIVSGPAELVDHVELDMNRLVADKQKGRIKSITPTEFGLKVEMYAADAALVNVAKMHGLFEKDNEQKKPELTPFSNEQVDKLIDVLRKNKK